MELEMETKSSTTKPDASEEDETSPLMEVNSSAETASLTETTTVAITPSSLKDCLFKWCCGFYLSVIFCLGIFIFFILPFMIKIRDYTPTFHVDSISVSSLKVSSYEISGNWNISFIVKNPEDGQPLYYYAIRVLVLYQNEYCLSLGNAESFYLRNGEECSVQAKLGGSSENVEKWVVRAIENDMNTRREMNIFVELEAFVISEPGMEKFRSKQSVKVSCNDLKVQLFSEDVTAGSMSSGNTVKCGLKFEVEGGVQESVKG